MRSIQMTSAQGYRDQLDRTCRFLARIEAVGPRRDVEYQDDVWAFFQNCWHLKDWLLNDSVVPAETKKPVIEAVHASSTLLLCRDMANGTKHLRLDDPSIGARHSHTNTIITPGAESRVDCLIEVDGKLLSAREVARQCVDEWMKLLTNAGLAVGQRS